MLLRWTEWIRCCHRSWVDFILTLLAAMPIAAVPKSSLDMTTWIRKREKTPVHLKAWLASSICLQTSSAQWWQLAIGYWLWQFLVPWSQLNWFGIDIDSIYKCACACVARMMDFHWYALLIWYAGMLYLILISCCYPSWVDLILMLLAAVPIDARGIAEV